MIIRILYINNVLLETNNDMETVTTFINFPESEKNILKLWDINDPFTIGLERSKNEQLFTFYDGPPFATGLPHYGHILAGTIKDSVTRFAHQSGYHVPRKWGWDCVAEGTLVELENGDSLEIEKLHDKEYNVIGYDNETNKTIVTPMFKLFDQGMKECIELLFENGVTLTCTPDHKIMTSDGYIEAKNIIIKNTNIVALCYESLNSSTELDLSTFTTKLLSRNNVGVKRVYDICVPATSSFIANGIVVHNCHGLPIEFEIEKQLNITTRDEILDMGISKYNNECRKIVMKYSSEWKTTISRMGRWIDFDNSYKTMDFSYMQSEWWVFKELWKKGMIYKGFKVMPYSTVCSTPLSNFEANMTDNYKEVIDVSAIIKFPIKDDPNTSFLAWTTTPWTLPANLALCVNPTLSYLKIHDIINNENYIIAENCINNVYSAKNNKKYKIMCKYNGSDFINTEYELPFDIYRKYSYVIVDNFVSDESGTGIVHLAPGFGEDDFRVCMLHGIIKKSDSIPIPIDVNGRFTSKFPIFEGIWVKDKSIDRKILKYIGNKVFSSKDYKHRYPFCWRSDTPLIYMAVPSWFINIEMIKEQILKNNENTYWVPNHVKELRFHNWLANARDWCVSRSRFWGTPLPIWTNGTETICIGSADELFELSGIRVNDLHRNNIDHITIPSKQGLSDLRRIDEVFDCWFESGCMPYAQQGYPFDNDTIDKFKNGFPANFIGEGIDQTRGWFYTLIVLGTALFDKCPFENVIVNGLVLAKDGKKMSKRLKNYPSPTYMFDKYGADAIRIYLINSSVVCGENLRFNEDGVQGLLKSILIPWSNAYKFMTQHCCELFKANKFVPTMYINAINNNKYDIDSMNITNIFDKYIVSLAHKFVLFVQNEMEQYQLQNIISELTVFIDKLTNVYIRMNRKRFKDVDQQNDSCNTLYYVLMILNIIVAPFCPFIVETYYQNMKKALPEKMQDISVHLLMIPNCVIPNEKYITPINLMYTIIQKARLCRQNKQISMKIPLNELFVVVAPASNCSMSSLIPYIKSELNIDKVIISDDSNKYVRVSVTLDRKKTGKRLRNETNNILTEIDNMNINTFDEIPDNVTICGHTISIDDLIISYSFYDNSGKYEYVGDNVCLVAIDTTITEKQLISAMIREVTSRIQKMRRDNKLRPDDNIKIYAFSENEFFNYVFKDNKNINKVSNCIEKQFVIGKCDNKINIIESNHDITISDYDMNVYFQIVVLEYIDSPIDMFKKL